MTKWVKGQPAAFRYQRGVAKPHPKHRPPYPKPEEIIDLCRRADLDPHESGALIYYGYRAMMQWQEGTRTMHPALWELFCLKCRPIVKRIESEKAATPALLQARAPDA